MKIVFGGKNNMRTTTLGRTGKEEDTAQQQIDPEELWLNTSISPELLIQLDPLDIDSEMVERAENPELEDFNLQSLPERRFSLRQEELERKLARVKYALGQGPAWLPAKIRGS